MLGRCERQTLRTQCVHRTHQLRGAQRLYRSNWFHLVPRLHRAYMPQWVLRLQRVHRAHRLQRVHWLHRSPRRHEPCRILWLLRVYGVHRFKFSAFIGFVGLIGFIGFIGLVRQLHWLQRGHRPAGSVLQGCPMQSSFVGRALHHCTRCRLRGPEGTKEGGHSLYSSQGRVRCFADPCVNRAISNCADSQRKSPKTSGLYS